MTGERRIEVFSAGCLACDETIVMVNELACPSCTVKVLDMKDPAVAKRAKSIGIRTVPAVLIDGKLADCCVRRGPDLAIVQAAGLGQLLG